MKFWSTLIVAIATLFCFGFAQDPQSNASPDAQKFIDSLKFQSGEVMLNSGLAKISLPPEFRFLGPKDAAKVLTELWGNPPGSNELGLIVPAKANLLSQDAWAIIVSWEEDGYVKDDDAAKINYNDLLKDMKKSALESNKQRAKEGYPTVELVGWAAQPHYDSSAKKMYWAKELKFQDSPANTLNYNIRMLGRKGVLVLNAVAGMEQIQEIEQATPTILGMIDFQPGHRYADYQHGTDKVATYGIAALVAGGVLAKTGLFAKLGLLFAKFAKVIIIAAIALIAVARKLFSRREA
jgi:uncharacterized membrane-anchored protein